MPSKGATMHIRPVIYDSYAALLEAGGARRGSQHNAFLEATSGGGRIKGSPVIKKALRESVGAPLSPSLTPMTSRTPNDRERSDVDQVDLAQHQAAN
tara:strand:- start:543 stop:833 length:291 start_codon:yes stop_codon:yes gene_type:complete